MNSKTINISLPSELVGRIDRQAKLEFSTRSDYIKRAIIAQLKSQDAFEPDIPIEDLEVILKKARREKLRRSLATFSPKEIDFND